MGGFLKKWFFLIVLAILLIFLIGCTQQTQTIQNSAPNDRATNTQPPAQEKPKPIFQMPEKKLEDLLLIKNDFSTEFTLNDQYSGCLSDAVEYHDGNKTSANALVQAGWLENCSVEFDRLSDQEIAGQKIPLESYFISISKYDKSKNYAEYFDKSINENKTGFSSDTETYTIIPQNFGEKSIFAKSVQAAFGITLIRYELRFTKGNYFINFTARGQSRHISDETVVDYAKKIEGRVE